MINFQIKDADGNVVNSALRINKHLGTTNQAADADLVAEDSAWSTEHRARGVAYIYIRAEFDTSVFPQGLPTFSAIVKGKKVYDPRTSTTAWSANAALCLRDYLCLIMVLMYHQSMRLMILSFPQRLILAMRM